ncbi:putative RING-H2 finger protein ATL53 [Andrographis paniculata]|uniref:putative RING-H2 finger protein ATL53 n=1 Tax=Andrographis paniculata TaxID=175694 RepID=UPI0021E89A1F|nr:putative RING-H2 finger protein ATL53 [Andrographis paniculata]
METYGKFLLVVDLIAIIIFIIIVCVAIIWSEEQSATVSEERVNNVQLTQIVIGVVPNNSEDVSETRRFWSLDLFLDNHGFVLDKFIEEKSRSKDSHCTICLEEYKDSEPLAVIKPCDHRYHVVCAKTWFAENDTCPLCRTRVFV